MDPVKISVTIPKKLQVSHLALKILMNCFSSKICHSLIHPSQFFKIIRRKKFDRNSTPPHIVRDNFDEVFNFEHRFFDRARFIKFPFSHKKWAKIWFKNPPEKVPFPVVTIR